MFKTSIGVFIVGNTVFYIFREYFDAFPINIFIVNIILNYFVLSILHILIRKNIFSEIIIELKDEPEDMFEPEDKSEDEVNEPDKDGLIQYFNILFSPRKFINSFIKNYSIFFKSSIILFIVTWMLVVVYMTFMPEFMDNFFHKLNLGNEPYFNKIYNLRVFTIVFAGFYLIWQYLNFFIMKKIFKQKIDFKKFWSGIFYIFGWNIILFLLIIIIGNITNKYVMTGFSVLIFIWFFIIVIKYIRGIFDKSFIKILSINFVNLLITFLITNAILYFIYLKT
jgi:hypothetical protein